jgi:hypothetical protein
MINLIKSELGAALADDFFGALLKIAAREEAPEFSILAYAHLCSVLLSN